MARQKPIHSGSEHLKAQRDRFIETARALECDEDEAAFKAKLAVIARQKPGTAIKPAKAGRKQEGG
jgi:hypothetical protein